MARRVLPQGPGSCGMADARRVFRLAQIAITRAGPGSGRRANALPDRSKNAFVLQFGGLRFSISLNHTGTAELFEVAVVACGSTCSYPASAFFFNVLICDSSCRTDSFGLHYEQRNDWSRRACAVESRSRFWGEQVHGHIERGELGQQVNAHAWMTARQPWRL